MVVWKRTLDVEVHLLAPALAHRVDRLTRVAARPRPAEHGKREDVQDECYRLFHVYNAEHE